MKKLYISLLPAIFFLSSQAQVSEGGTPVGITHAGTLEKNIPVAVMPSFDLAALMNEDLVNDQRKDIPWRFGYNFSVNLNPDNSGIWEITENGNRLWRLKIFSKKAVSMNIIFGEYVIPEGGKVFVYNENGTHILGAFTYRNNLPHRKLGVDLIPGDAIIVEYFEPSTVAGKGKLMIEQVTHGYRGSPSSAKDFGDSGPCNNNVVCPEGAPWQDQIRASAMNLVNGNTWCSGALVNNTCQDGTPYYLTANHCLSGSVASWVFRFNYESPTCTPSADGPYNFTVSGATLRANNGSSDFALLELSSAPPSTYNVFYAGWDRSGTVPQKQVGIHHPSGDVKKISFDDEPALDTISYGISVWQISSWNDGTTEGGSSGSPLFDQNARIIGQLYGGSASCSSLTDDNYGRFSVSWDLGGTPSTQLKDWLDLCNTGEVFIDGYDPASTAATIDAATLSIGGLSGVFCGENLDSLKPFAIIANKGIDTLVKITVVFELDSVADSTVWAGVLPADSTDTVFFTPFLPAAGTHVFTVTVKNPNDSIDQKGLNDTKNQSFKFVSSPEYAIFTLKTDNYGSEISWDIKDSAGTLWYSGGGYSDINGGETMVDSLCLEKGCYNFTIYDFYGDGLSGNGGTGTQGTYFFLNTANDTIAHIANVDFGYQENNSFCVPDSVTGENRPAASGPALSIFPNPNNGKFVLTFTGEKENNGSVEIVVSDMFGKTIYHYQSGSHGPSVSIDLSGISPGIYFVKILTGSVSAVKKIIVSR